jgi:hypothetical protein
MDRTGAALSEAAAKLGADQVHVLSKDPENRRVRVHVNLMPLSIDCEMEDRHSL